VSNRGYSELGKGFESFDQRMFWLDIAGRSSVWRKTSAPKKVSRLID